jgi:hypothetical protein
MRSDGTTISFQDDKGNFQTKEVPSARSVFDYPEAYPEAYRPGATIRTQTTGYYHDVHGNLRHFDIHPSDDY